MKGESPVCEWKAYISSDYPGLERCLSDLEQWSREFTATCGITGSALNKNNKILNDIDIIAIVRDPNIQFLPTHFSEIGWQEYLELQKSNEVDIFVTHYEGYEQLRLELYPLSIVERILALEQFNVRRIGQGPLRTKPTIFHGVDGASKFITTQPISKHGVYCTEIDSCIWEDRTLFVGVHLERLLLAKLLFDELQIDIVQKRTWRGLREIFASFPTKDLPFNGEVERIFFGSKKLSQSAKMHIRHLLLQREDLVDSYADL